MHIFTACASKAPLINHVPCSSRLCKSFVQHHLSQGSLEAAFSLLLQHLPQLASSSPKLAGSCTRTWLALVVAAAAAGQQDLQAQVIEVMRQAAVGQLQHVDMAWVSCLPAQLAC
jgi:hypothetical protein